MAPPGRLLLLSAAALVPAAVRSQSFIPAVELQPVDATLRGVVYLDADRDGTRGGDEGPVSGAIVKLFDCNTGRRVGIARTGNEGRYGITVTSDSLPDPGGDSSSRGCFYVQYTVPESVLAGAEFTTPLNGETDDIYLGAGDRRGGLEAGVYGGTPEPTSRWITPAPDGTTAAPTEELVLTLVPTRRPATAAPTLAPATDAPVITVVAASPVGGEAAETAAPYASLPMVLLPVPDDMPAAALVDEATGEAAAAETGPAVPDQVEGSTAGEAMAADSDSAVSDQIEGSTTGEVIITETDTIVSDQIDESDVTLEELEEGRPEEAEESGEVTIETETAEVTTETGTPAEPSVDASEPDAIEDGEPSGAAEAEPEEADAGEPAGPSTGPMDVSAGVIVRLDGLVTMDETARTAFEGVCTEFLSGVLKEFENPIYNVGCALVGQTAVSRRRRRLGRRVPHRTRRRRLQAGIEAELEVSGTVDRTERVRRPEDVMLESLLVGTFNVQGYLFADALRGEGAAFQSLSDVSGVRLLDDDGQVEGAQDADEAPGGSWYDVFTTPAGMAGAAAGGAVLLCLVLVAAGRSRRRKRRLREEHDLEPDLEGDHSLEGGKRPRTPVNSPNGNTRSTVSPSSSSVRSHVSPCSSGEVEVSLPDPRFRGLPSPSPTSLRNRVRRDVMTPPGKLGIMVANTNSHGPAVHTIRPGSAMEGLVYVNDIIVSVNEVDTSGYTAEQITQVMRDTVGEERKITVLSAHR